ncbi:MAG: tRNA uridine-5-carboxymethylaminomethyl(34) synthesis GTPase MnmE [Gammaproteobacteria bacterium]|nr:tRNA uridine-5-carboxymethylaminomethyl(34) synthesis GTPase MnmE [Gammaproteobacteria bacterium]
MSATATIVALATPPGFGGIAVVRVSGPATRTLTQSLLNELPPPRQALTRSFRGADGVVLDQGLALFFPAPHSFTGEDVLELHAHGAPVVVDMLLQRLLVLGARLARPGEFSERAFLNGKMDLAQAEAVADLISAGSETAARAALRSLQGEFSRRVRARVEQLTRLRMYVEAAIDFPEEEIDFLADARIVAELIMVEDGLTELLQATQQGTLLHDGMTVVLAGAPNAGKSSLLNALAEQETAIVSSIPGTTRDVLRERIHIDGMPLHVVDTAGLRATDDEIENEGIRRARAQMERADRILLLVDDAAGDTKALDEAQQRLPPHIPRTLIRNKIDLSHRAAGVVEASTGSEIALSTKTGAGLDTLRAHLKAVMGYQSAGEGTFIARRRHLDAVERALVHVTQGRTALTEARAGELLAEELRQAQQALGEITGEFTSDDLLGRIFSSFCIGK